MNVHYILRFTFRFSDWDAVICSNNVMLSITFINTFLTYWAPDYMAASNVPTLMDQIMNGNPLVLIKTEIA